MGICFVNINNQFNRFQLNALAQRILKGFWQVCVQIKQLD